ncbi:MAG TPA: hypothetical protein VFB78_17425 [Acidimicrobiales bacterium]|nr:hypothetical protein [Acidimicrobiales bacterium]
MTLLLAVIVGFLGARLLWLLLGPVFASPVFQRLNYRDRVLPTAGGLLVALVALFAEAARLTAGAAGIGDRGLTAARAGVVVAALGFGLVGLLDDIAGTADARGLRGHVGALVETGRLTTGALKLTAGAAVAAVAVAPFAHDSFGPFVVDAALVALAANLGNLFDRAPGRATKVATLLFVVLALASTGAVELTPVAIVVGGALGLLLDDLHERVMLGDAGANVIGAALGLGVVATSSLTVRVVVLVALVGATVASEVVSFSRVIERAAPLRWADNLGRK